MYSQACGHRRLVPKQLQVFSYLRLLVQDMFVSTGFFCRSNRQQAQAEDGDEADADLFCGLGMWGVFRVLLRLFRVVCCDVSGVGWRSMLLQRSWRFHFFIESFVRALFFLFRAMLSYTVQNNMTRTRINRIKKARIGFPFPVTTWQLIWLLARSQAGKQPSLPVSHVPFSSRHVVYLLQQCNAMRESFFFPSRCKLLYSPFFVLSAPIINNTW